MRWETERLVDGVDEMIRIGKLAEVPIHISHFKAAGRIAWEINAMDQAIEHIEAERARGMDITVDFYPYDCGSAMLSQMVPPSLLQGDIDARIQELGTPEGIVALRRLLCDGEPGWDNLSASIGWDQIYIMSAKLPENKRFVGKTGTESVDAFGYEDPAALVGTILASEKGDVININRSMRQEDIDKVAQLPYAHLISDSLYGDMLRPHPRLFGAFPKFLREYVRERKLLTLETAIHKMTGMPARRAFQGKIGLLRPGYRADVLVFSSDAFQDQATYDEPIQLAEGLDYMFVGGRLKTKNGRLLSRIVD